MARAELRLTAALVLVGFAWGATAHEYHVSLAEVEHNPETGHLEVALKVLPEDLEEAVSGTRGTAVRLEADGADELLAAYLESRFRVRDPAGEAQPLTWVGKEVSHREAWLYFEVPVEPGVAWTLENRMLFDVHPGQVNTVLFRAAGSLSTWTFTARSGPVELPIGR